MRVRLSVSLPGYRRGDVIDVDGRSVWSRSMLARGWFIDLDDTADDDADDDDADGSDGGS